MKMIFLRERDETGFYSSHRCTPDLKATGEVPPHSRRHRRPGSGCRHR
jgi:hypothetical protein